MLDAVSKNMLTQTHVTNEKVAAVLSEFSDHSDHSDQPKLPAVPRLRSLTLKAFHLEEGNATNLIIALNSIVSRASQVATESSKAVPRLVHWSAEKCPAFKSTQIIKDGRSRVPVLIG